MTAPALDLTAPQLRPYYVNDSAFIIQSFLRSYWTGAIRETPVKSATYYKEHHAWIMRVFQTTGYAILVAHAAGEYDAILGWALVEARDPVILHYVYVKEALRQMGLARRLIEAATIDPRTMVYTHVTRIGNTIMRRYPEATYNPWILAGNE